jgi:hypothetical protein
VTDIIELIDNAIWDTSESPDAMRWTAEPAPVGKTWRERLMSDAIIELVLRRSRVAAHLRDDRRVP